MTPHEVGRKAGEAARQGDWSRVAHWQRFAPLPSDRDAYAEFKRGYADANPAPRPVR